MLIPGKLTGQWVRRFRRSAKLDDSGGARIKPRSIYILPTKQGVIMAILLLLMLIGSVNYGSNLGYLFTFLLGAIWLSSILHTWRNLLGLSLTPQHAPAVFAGQEAGFRLIMQNPSELDRFGISIMTTGGIPDQADLPANATQALLLTLQTTVRGQLTLPDVSIHSRYPFGFFHAWTYARLDMSCLIYPRPTSQGEPPSEPIYNASDSGDRGVGADDFVGLRSFRSSDSPRHIDWKAVARERGLYSKQFGGDRREQISLDWDLLDDPDDEARLSQLCRFILLAHERQQSYGLKLPNLTLAANLGESHKHHCLSALANFKVDS